MRYFETLVAQFLFGKKLFRILIVLALGSFWMVGWQSGQPANAGQTGPYTIYLNFVFRAPNPPPETTVYQTGPDVYSTSYYIKSINMNADTGLDTLAYNRGCELGTRDANLPNAQSNLVILDYGRPIYDMINGSNQYGARLFSTATRVDLNQIAISARSFGVGYYICTGSDFDSKTVVGIGTNNLDYAGCPNCSVTFGHGQAWANMVNGVNDWLVQNGYSRQVSAAGANDIEMSWNSFTQTKAWLDGYDSANRFEMINFGALPGCPYFGAEGAQCGGTNPLDLTTRYRWSLEEAWYVIWGSPPVYPVPEIYSNNGVNAQQWYLMSLYAYNAHGLAIQFRGVMTQMQACQQVSGDPTCPALDNTPAQGWNQLQSLVNGNANTAHPILFSTDIRW
jgi:hypothetical protein